MVVHRLAGGLASLLGFVQGESEVAPFGIAEQLLQLPGEPELDSLFLADNCFEPGKKGSDLVGLHW